MLKTGFVPSKFHNARTILIHKGGDHDMLHNWRPITICSVLRRVIERTLVKRLYEYVTLNANQRGFIHSPGTHLNTSLLELILQSAKNNQSDVSIVFLDVQKAFDNIGHSHLRQTLNSA